jgi:hypothetical protein
MSKYYVYKHRIKGTNNVFYIGLGSQQNYRRAKTIYGRNKHWNRIYKKYGFEYDILQDNLSLNEARELEQLLIKTYGRKDLKEGCLVNYTDGGEGTINLIKTKEQIEKWKKSNKGKQDGDKNTMFGKNRGLHHLSKTVLNFETGIFYDCAIDACETTNIPYSSFKCKLNGSMKNNTMFNYV